MIKTFSADRSTLPESIIQILLDIYAEKTELPVALYQVDSNKLIWYKKGYYSPLCLMLSSVPEFNTLCSNDHIYRCLSASGELELCHVGLWNIALPIRIDDKLVSVLLTGQRRLKDITRNQSSFNTFSSFISRIENKVIDSESLRVAFDRTPFIDQHEFDSHLLESLSNIHAYIHSWASSINEEDKILKRRLQQLAHEFLLPIQSILADAENLYDEIDNPELKEIAENIMQEMQRLALIAENMRSSMLQGEEPRVHYGNYNLYKCLIKNVEIFRKEAEQKGIAILKPYTSSGNFPEIEMSPDNMTRAFANLIHNAVKYSYRSTSKERYIQQF